MRRTKQEAQATRDAILDAAETVFHAKGVARTTLAEIASAAKLTRGAIYWHFEGKTELFRAMTERVSGPEEEFFRQRAEGDLGASLQGLQDLTLEMIRRFVGNEHAQRVHDILLFRCEYVGEMGGAMQARKDQEEAFERAVLESFARARGEDGLAEGWSPETASACLRCAVMGAIADWLRLDRRYDLVDVADALLQSLFAGFRRERRAAVR